MKARILTLAITATLALGAVADALAASWTD